MFTALLQDRVCQTCRAARRGAAWECRSCGRQTCEHRCKLKTNDGKATCGTCARNPKIAASNP